MRKFIALQNDVYYSVVEENGKKNFFANVKGTGYDTRKDVTPKESPDDDLMKEIYDRPAICAEMSPQLQTFVNKLEANYNALKA